MRTTWRSCKDWIDYGLPLSTTSDEACKLYDASLSQYVGWYDDPNFGGYENTLKKMLEADPEFVMGHVIANGSMLPGTFSLPADDKIRVNIEKTIELAANQPLTDLERKHVTVLKYLADGEALIAGNTLESMLMDNPLDILSARLLLVVYFMRGEYMRVRDTIGRIKGFWKPSMPLYGYLHGLHAFALEETNMFEDAVKVARKGLEFNRQDIFSTHAIAHVYETQGKPEEGIKLLSDTENDWNVCTMLACHVYWHSGIFNIEKGNFDEALGVFDNELLRRFKEKPNVTHLTDASSFLYRIRTEGVDVAVRWRDLYEKSKAFIDQHSLTFYDAHILMSLLGTEDKTISQQFMESLKSSVRNETGHSKQLSENILLPLCEAIASHENGDSARAVDLLYPIRYDIFKLGGSLAQRDVFNILLIDAAVKSENKDHNKLARFLISEREALKERSPLTDRMMHRFLATHGS